MTFGIGGSINAVFQYYSNFIHLVINVLQWVNNNQKVMNCKSEIEQFEVYMTHTGLQTK